jgi:hypothetical protein
LTSTYLFLLSPDSSEQENTRKGYLRIAGHLIVRQLRETTIVLHNEIASFTIFEGVTWAMEQFKKI